MAIEDRGHIRRVVERYHGSLEAWAEHCRLVQLSVGIRRCQLVEYAELHFDQGPDATEAAVLAHPVHGPVFGCQTLFQAPKHYNDELCEDGDLIGAYGQRDVLRGLMEFHSYQSVRGEFEGVLQRRSFRILHPHTAYLILTWVNQNHPNPRKFLEKPEVRSKFSNELAVEKFDAPDFD